MVSYLQMYEALLYLVNDFKTDAAGIFEVDKPPLLYRSNVDLPISRISEEALDSHYKSNVIVINNRSNLDIHSRLRGFMDEHKIRALMISKIYAKGKYYGYFMVYQERFRIWQEDEVSLMKYFTSIIALQIANSNKEEDE